MLYVRSRQKCVLVCLVACLLLPVVAHAQLVTAPGPGAAPAVRVIDTTGTERTFFAYHPLFAGGVRIALGDVTGDGVLDIVTAPGPGGGPHVRVWNGVDLTEVGGFFAYHPTFPGGVFVAAGDVDGDGRADIITGAGPGGGPHVRVWSGVDFHEIGGFFAYDPSFPGGVTVAAGDVDGDGRADVITGAGPGGGPHVRIWSGADFSETFGFFAYHPSFPGGVNVAAGDVDGDGRADVITGAGPGGGPHVRVWNINGFAEIGGFFVDDPAFPGGVNVGVVELTGDNRVEIVTGLGPGGLPIASIWSSDLTLMGSYFAFDPSLTAGVYVGSIGTSNALRFTSANSTTFPLGAAGSFTVATTGGATPTLTVTGALPAGVTFTDNGDRTATLAGTPGAGTAGSYPLTFSATNGGASPVTQSFTLTVSEAPAITSANTATFNIGSVGSSFTVTTTGSPTPDITVSGALPSGITFTDNDNGTATLGGTAAPGTSGAYPLVLTASNGVGSAATQNFTLTIQQGAAITSANATTFTAGAAGTFTVTTTGAPTPGTIGVTGALPAGVTFVNNGNGTATLAGTPTASGTFPLTISASNGVGSPASQSFTLTVNQAPAITSAATVTFLIGASGTFTVTATGFPTAAIVQGGAALPAGVTFVDNGNGTALLAGTPNPGTGGSYALTFTASNGVGAPAVQSFTLTVHQAPAITSASNVTFAAGTPGSFTVTTTGFPTPAVARGGVALPSGITFTDNGDGTATLSGTPGASSGGTYAITFTATNSVGSTAPQAFTLTVQQAPAITSATSTTFIVGTPGTFTVTTTGFPTASIGVAGALPAGVTFLDNGNGTATLAGTPDPGTGGTYPLTITATSVAGAATPQSFTLTVNQPAAITSANTATFISSTPGTPGTFTITTSGVPTVTTLTRGGVALPSGITYVDNGDGTGTLSGTPGAGTGGAYAITFTATNGVGSPAVQNFTLNVHQVPAITSAASTTFTVGTPGSFTVTTTGFPTPTVTHTGTLPTGVTFTGATRVLAGTATQTGAFPLQFTAANSVPPDAVQNFTLNVVCPAITVNAPSLTVGLYQIGYTPATFTQTGSTGSTLSWSATGLPAGLSISPTTGVLSGTPSDTVLNASVAVTVTDNFDCVGNGNVTLTVRPRTDNENYLGGVGNTQYAVGVAGISTPHVAFSDNVKTGDNGPGALSVVFNAPANGAVLEGVTDGTFVYSPNVGFAGPTDSFTYTLTDGNGVTNTGTVTINLNSLVWYVNSASAGGDGRSHAPFNSLDDAEAPSGAGSRIYVHTGGATTTGNLAMDANQWLNGAGLAFTLNSLTIPAGTRPTLTGTVTLGNGVIVQAVNFTPSGIPAMTATGLTVGAIVGQVNVTGGTNALSLTNNSGPVSVVGSIFTNASGAEVLINQGTGNVLIAAIINSNVGRSIDIQNRTGGTVEFAGSVTDTGQGVFLNANTGSTITFNAGVTLSTGSNPAFTATNGGTVNVCALVECSSSPLTNTITTTTGIALNVANTTIGGNGLTFRSISANGAANGIVLNSTGASGALTVTGDGTGVSNGSGGLIQNIPGTGIKLTNTRASFRQLNINGTGSGTPGTPGAEGHGIDINNVTNFSFEDASIVNAGAGNEEHGIKILNMLGTSLIEDVVFDEIQEDMIEVRHDSATPGNATFRRLNFQDHKAGFGEAGMEIQTNLPVGASTTILIDDCDFAINTNAVLGINVGTSATHAGTLTLTAQANTFNGANAFGSGSFQVLGGGTGTANYFVLNNTITNTRFDGIRVNNDDTGTTNATITGNTVTGSGATNNGEGITVRQDANGSMNVLIANNTITQFNANGIRLQSQDNNIDVNNSTYELIATVLNNTATVRPGGFGAGLLVEIATGDGVSRNDAWLNISGNTFSGTNTTPFFDFDITIQLNEPPSVGASGRVTQLRPTGAVNASELDDANNNAQTSIYEFNPPGPTNTITFGGGVPPTP